MLDLGLRQLEALEGGRSDAKPIPLVVGQAPVRVDQLQAGGLRIYQSDGEATFGKELLENIGEYLDQLIFPEREVQLM